jgi:hypothetical protein
MDGSFIGFFSYVGADSGHAGPAWHALTNIGEYRRLSKAFLFDQLITD